VGQLRLGELPLALSNPLRHEGNARGRSFAAALFLQMHLLRCKRKVVLHGIVQILR
jgi:hypothetical protein